MKDTLTHDWDQSKVIDDIDFDEKDAKEFRKLLGTKDEAPEDGTLATMTVGQILKGHIVEISKDYVVVDVGLKSEGLVPVAEFTEPEELISG